MRVHITLKDKSHFMLNNVMYLGLMKHMIDGKYKRIMFFHDDKFGTLVYALSDIVEMHTDDI